MPPTGPKRKRGQSNGGLRRPVSTIGQCMHGGYGWQEAECCRCKTRASLPLDAICRPRDTPVWKLESFVSVPTFRHAPVQAAGTNPGR